MEIVLGCLIFLQIIQLFILVYIGAFIYKFKKDIASLFIDLLELMAPVEKKEPLEKEKNKTWDQKYEEELLIKEKMRNLNSGLQDVPNSRV